MDTVANFLTALHNAVRVRQARVVVPASRLNRALARFLAEHGYVAAVRVSDDAVRPMVTLTLKYDEQERPKIQGLRRLSKPGRRRYVGHTEIPFSHDGMGVIVLSTSQGLMDDKKARKTKTGGELLCEVW